VQLNTNQTNKTLCWRYFTDLALTTWDNQCFCWLLIHE